MSSVAAPQRAVAGAVPRHARAHVVTVTHNSSSTLGPYLAGIAASAEHVAGVTVVDNASTDDTVERLRTLQTMAGVPVEIVENANTGFAGGYAAAAASRFDRGAPVLCLNPDVILAPDAVRTMLEVLESRPDAAVVTVPLVESDGTPDSASRRRLPTLHGSMVYSVLGKLTPKALRYNAREDDAAHRTVTLESGLAVTELEATTGAVMLVAPDFRTLDGGVFDRDYWMYGEDLQLCADARAAGRRVLIAETAASVHVKGVSSGRPRSRRSNRAFHDAMLRYARKNLVSSPLAVAVVAVGVEAHFAFSELRAVPARIRRRRAAR